MVREQVRYKYCKEHTGRPLETDNGRLEEKLELDLSVEIVGKSKIVTGDEKWIYYDSPVNKKQLLSPDQASLRIPKPEIGENM